MQNGERKRKKKNYRSTLSAFTPLLNHRACITLTVYTPWLGLISVTRGNSPWWRLHLLAVQSRDVGEELPWPRVFQRKRNALISSSRAFPSQRIHLRLFEYRGKHSWPITRGRGGELDNAVRLSSVSLGERVISSDERCVAIQIPVTRIVRRIPRLTQVRI